MGAMVSHRTSIYMDAAEVVDAAKLAMSMKPAGCADEVAWIWEGIFVCLSVISDYNANSAEEFIANCAQEIDHY